MVCNEGKALHLEAMCAEGKLPNIRTSRNAFAIQTIV